MISVLFHLLQICKIQQQKKVQYSKQIVGLHFENDLKLNYRTIMLSNLLLVLCITYNVFCTFEF